MIVGPTYFLVSTDKVLMNIIQKIEIPTIMTVYVEYKRARNCPIKYETCLQLKQSCTSIYETQGSFNLK